MLYFELWFDVERRYKTMLPMVDTPAETLWFDVVERRYKTIFGRDTHVQHQLWFDI